MDQKGFMGAEFWLLFYDDTNFTLIIIQLRGHQNGGFILLRFTFINFITKLLLRTLGNRIL